MKLKTNLLALTSSLLLAVGGQAAAQTPKDQIALQLGAIQMGYTVPFAVSANSTATQKQQAVNSLVMGRNAMNATVALPAATVKGVVKSPGVNTADYRDQLYSAVEYVVTSPVSASINGTVVMSNNATVTVNATALRAAAVSNDWMTPVPYALESRSSVDTQTLRAELVAAGLLAVASDNSTKSFFIFSPDTATGVSRGTAGEYFKLHFDAKGNNLIGLGFRYNGVYESFETMVNRRIATNDRIITKPGNFVATQIHLPFGSKDITPINLTNKPGDTCTTFTAIFVQPESEPLLKSVSYVGLLGPFWLFTSTSSGIGTTSPTFPLTLNGIKYRLYVVAFNFTSQQVKIAIES